MPDYYFRAIVSGWLNDCKKRPTEEEVKQSIREDIKAYDIEIEAVKED